MVDYAPRDITPSGYKKGDLVTLLYRQVGRIFIPVSHFNDIGNAALTAIGGSKPVALLFDKTTAEEADTVILKPQDFDETVAASIYIYWSSAGTSATNGVVWDVDYLARALAEDVGASVSNLTTTDLDSATADVLNRSDALTLPADTLADDDLLYLNLRREAADSADTVDADVAFYGMLITYQSKPSIYDS